MEKWNGYLRSGELTDKILIKGEEIPDGYYHLGCEVLVKHIDGDYLILKRDANKESYPNFYEATAGGSAIFGEDSIQCATRELFEETGIECSKFEFVKYTIYDEDKFLLYSYVCTVDIEKYSIKLQSGETTNYKWINKEKFIEFLNSDKVIPRQKEMYLKLITQ